MYNLSSTYHDSSTLYLRDLSVAVEVRHTFCLEPLFAGTKSTANVWHELILFRTYCLGSDRSFIPGRPKIKQVCDFSLNEGLDVNSLLRRCFFASPKSTFSLCFLPYHQQIMLPAAIQTTSTIVDEQYFISPPSLPYHTLDGSDTHPVSRQAPLSPLSKTL